MNKNQKIRKTLAIVGIAILVGLYVMAFIFALAENPNSMRMFAVSIVATVIIPVFIYVINMFLKLGRDKKEFNEDIAAGKYVPKVDAEADSRKITVSENDAEVKTTVSDDNTKAKIAVSGDNTEIKTTASDDSTGTKITVSDDSADVKAIVSDDNTKAKITASDDSTEE